MDQPQADNHTMQRSGPSQRSNRSASTFVPSPLSSLHHQPTYHSVPTLQEEGFAHNASESMSADEHMEGRAQEPGTSELGIQGSSAGHTFSGESTPTQPGSASFLLSPAMARFQKREKRNSDPLGGEEDLAPCGHNRYTSLGRSHASEHDIELSPGLAGKGSDATFEDLQGT